MRAFVTPKVSLFLLLGGGIGIGFSAVELLFAVALQFFLTALGVANVQVSGAGKYLPQLNLVQAFAFFLFAGTLRATAQWVQINMQSMTQCSFDRTQKERLLSWALNSPSVSSAEFMTLFHERTQASGMFVWNLQALFVQGTTAILLLASLFVLSPIPSLCILLLGSALFWGMRRLDQKIKEASEIINAESRNTNRRVLLAIKNLFLIQIYGTQEQEKELILKSIVRHTDSHVSAHRVSGIKFVLPQILGTVLICLISLIWRLQKGNSAAELIPYFYLFVRFTQSASSFSQLTTNLKLGLPQIRDLFGWWKKRNQLEPKKLNTAPKGSNHEWAVQSNFGWSLENASFRYPQNRNYVFKNLNLKILPGQALVVVGTSGVGKSTLLGLILGYLRLESGTIYLEKEDLKTNLLEAREKLLPFIAYVGPECFLIDGTIRENLIYGSKRSLTDAELRESLQKADCSFVETLPEGLDHQISEQGLGLSAGQKQRLSLARAFLRNPKALILDEATANLDSESESRLLKTLASLKGELTMIIVTHREGPKSIADSILDLNKINSELTIKLQS